MIRFNNEPVYLRFTYQKNMKQLELKDIIKKKLCAIPFFLSNSLRLIFFEQPVALRNVL